MRLLKIPSGHFTRVAYAGAQSLLTIHLDGAMKIRLWNLAGNAELVEMTAQQASLARLLFLHGGARFLRIEGAWPDGELLPAGEQASRIWSGINVEGKPAWQPFAFGPDGATVLFCHAGRIDERYQTHFHLKAPDGSVPDLYRDRSMFTASAAFSPDGRFVAMSTGNEVVAVWDVAQRSEVHQFVHSGRVSGVAFTSNDRLAVAAGRSVRMWTGMDGNAVKKFRAFRKFVNALAVSPDLKLFAAGDRAGVVRVWDAASGREVKEYEWGIGEVRDIAFSPDGATAAAAGMSAVAVWDLD